MIAETLGFDSELSCPSSMASEDKVIADSRHKIGAKDPQQASIIARGRNRNSTLTDLIIRHSECFIGWINRTELAFIPEARDP